MYNLAAHLTKACSVAKRTLPMFVAIYLLSWRANAERQSRSTVGVPQAIYQHDCSSSPYTALTHRPSNVRVLKRPRSPFGLASNGRGRSAHARQPAKQRASGGAAPTGGERASAGRSGRAFRTGDGALSVAAAGPARAAHSCRAAHPGARGGAPARVRQRVRAGRAPRVVGHSRTAGNRPRGGRACAAVWRGAAARHTRHAGAPGLPFACSGRVCDGRRRGARSARQHARAP
jgi:hypothetical protein